MVPNFQTEKIRNYIMCDSNLIANALLQKTGIIIKRSNPIGLILYYLEVDHL